MDADSVAAWAAVASAGAAALAAGLSWWTVRQTRKLWTIEHAPNLQLIPDFDPVSGEIALEVHNTGGGFARNAAVFYVQGGQYILEYTPPNGIIPPGRGLRIETDLRKVTPLDELVVAATICSDVNNTTHARAIDGTHKTWTGQAAIEKTHRRILYTLLGVHLEELQPGGHVTGYASTP